MSSLGGCWGSAGSFSLVVGVLREAGVWLPLETASWSSLRPLEELAPRLLCDRLQEPFPLCLMWQVGGFRGHYCRIHTGLRGLLGLQGGDLGGPGEVLARPCRPHVVPWVGVPPGCLQTRRRLLVRLRARMAAHSPFRKLLNVCPTSHFLRTAVEVTLATLECARSSLPELRPGRREAGFPKSRASTKPFKPRLVTMACFFPCCFWNLNLEKVCCVVM